MTKRQA